MENQEESKAKTAHGNKGRLLGRVRDRESVEKGAAALRKGQLRDCSHCGTPAWRKPSAIAGDNTFCSKQCYFDYQKGREKSEAFKEFCRGRTGEKSPSWRGGITPESVRIRNSSKTRAWRRLVFERDEHRCQDCGAGRPEGSKGFLHAHHIVGFAENPDIRHEVSNGVTLCKKCHYARHRK